MVNVATSDLTLEQVMMEHSGANTSAFLKAIDDWRREHPSVFRETIINNNMPECCRNCPNNKNEFCNCARPAMEQFTY